MRRIRGGAAAARCAGLLLLGGSLACGGLPFGSEPTRPIVGPDLVGTKLVAPAPAFATAPFGQASSSIGPFGKAPGLVLQQAFPGSGVGEPLQVVAVFSEPMVPLGDLDSMAGSVPLACDPPGGLVPRWAGTTTAVLVAPRQGLPAATKYTCRVPRRTKAVSGARLEQEVSWSFETPRLHLRADTPRAGEEAADPAAPVRVRFDQEVPPELAQRLLRVTAGDAEVAFRAEAVPGDPYGIRIRADLPKDAAVRVTLPAGAVGAEGDLPTRAEQVVAFRTYPPLRVTDAGPGGAEVDPDGWMSMSFTTPVPSKEVAAHLTLDPQPPDWHPPAQAWGWVRWTYGVRLAPRTKYRATLSAGVTDKYGQTLADDHTWTFTTGDLSPRWAVPSGLAIYPAHNPPELPFRRTNVRQLTVLAGPVNPDHVSGPGSEPRLTGAPTAVPPTGSTNVSAQGLLDLRPWLDADGHGWIGTRFASPDLREDHRPVERTGVLVVTDLGATVKLEPGATEVLVTSLATGEPVPDVDVSLRYSGELHPDPEIPLGRTDAHGWMRAEGNPVPTWDRWDRPVAVMLRKGTDQSVVFGDWTPAWGGFQNDGFEIRDHAFADRGLYRLGDPVHVHATFRRADAKGLSAVGAAEVEWTLDDPAGTAVAHGAGSLVGDGAFDVETALPGQGSLGDWTVRVEAKGRGWTRTASASIPVKAYRPAAFRVETHAPASAAAGDTVTVQADARYLFGAPMRNATVTFRGYAGASPFRPNGWTGFDFGPMRAWWQDGAEDRTAAPRVLDGHPALADGHATWEVALEDPAWSREPHTLSVEAEVTDVDHQRIASSQRVTVLPAAYAVGLRPGTRVGQVGAAVAVEAVAVSGEGEAVGGRPIEISVVARRFDTVRERAMDGTWRYVTTTTDTEVTRGSVRSSDAPARFEFEPKEGGLHVFVGRSTDDAGHVTTSETSVYVAGSDDGWARDEGRAWLIPDRSAYPPGATAKVAVKGHVPGSWALVTVEREGVLWREVKRLEGSSPVIEVPLKKEWIPGVRLSVVAVTGAGPQDSPEKGRPEIVYGVTELAVDPSDRHLAVEVKTARQKLRPRDTVELDVAVTRAGKAAKSTLVTLYAVDESVLTLTAYRTPDAFDSMYRAHAQDVLTLDNRQAVLDRARYLSKGGDPGGGGGDDEADTGGPEIRTKFLTTVAWQSLRTGPDGTVHASFPLPDNLTEFRVMAVAEQADAFGSDEQAIRVSRPLVLRPALPRLMRAGDEAWAGVVVHNDTEARARITVEATVEGPLELLGAPIEVDVEAGAAAEVPFHLKALEAGTARLVFRGVAGDEHDGLEVTLPIRQDARFESVGTSALVTGSWTEQLALPDGARPGLGGLQVSLGTTALAGTDHALGYLVEYPYGCAEQITSRGTGALAVLGVRDRSGSAMSEAALRQVVQSVLDRLPAYETWGGGYGYWAGQRDQPSIQATRYVLEFLASAREAGFEVDEAQMASSVAWLRGYPNRSEYRRATVEDRRRMRAEIALALAAAGSPDAGALGRLYDERDQLSVQHRAELLTALHRESPNDPRAAALARELAPKIFVEAAGASVRDDSPARWWGSDDRATAAVLEAFTRLGDQPLTPRLAQHLATSRRSGRWHDTRATAAALRALAAFAQRYETDDDEVDAVITLAGTELLHEKLPVPGTRALDIPLADLRSGPLDVRGDRIWFAGRLTYAPQVPKAREEGFWLDRRLELVDGAGADQTVVRGSTVRVTLTIATPVERFDVAVRDPFPAGFEAVDTTLATASRGDAGLLEDDGDEGSDEEEASGWLEYGGRTFDHTEQDDGEIRLFAGSLPPGIHTFRYALRATSPGVYAHPAAWAEEMYEPENFGSTAGGTLVIGTH